MGNPGLQILGFNRNVRLYCALSLLQRSILLYVTLRSKTVCDDDPTTLYLFAVLLLLLAAGDASQLGAGYCHRRGEC